MNQSIKFCIGLIALTLLVGFGFGNKNQTTTSDNGGATQAQQPIDLETMQATVFKTPRPVPNFSLVTDENKRFNPDNLKGQWSLLFFGFSHCPAMCPTTLAQLNQVYRKLPTNSETPNQVVFITIDPQRDTSERLHDYLSKFNANFVGVTGDEAQLATMRKAFGVLVLPPAKHDHHGHYNIDHSGAILLVNPKSEIVALFSTPHDVNTIVTELTEIKRQLG